MGKKAKGPDGRTTTPINLRVAPELRARLDAARAASGRTLTAEIIARLENSLTSPDDTDQTFVPGLLAVAAAMNAAGYSAGFASTFDAGRAAKWWDEPFAFSQAVAAAQHIFEALRPPGAVELPAAFKGTAKGIDVQALIGAMGTGIANGILAEIASDEPTSATAIARAPKLRRDLGSDLVARIRAVTKQKAERK
ncbi:TraY domain-containing protein [Rhodoplanes sp. Z2-YC6860]|uniref:TraY domain-containing protein n=1 Tax=Rhodoplanes sp. Z2-YC6860 TaxID=674703 RepID=UPI0008314D02|nr:TraY domain-containing protein [Rhodoplanes sp. Z2-YC6860]